MKYGRIGALAASIFASGGSPHELALAVAVGASIGVLPLVWGTTVVCALLAGHFRLNQLCVQAVNYVVYPLQLALLVPFYRLGARIFPWGPAVSVESLTRGFTNDVTGHCAGIVVATLKAVAAWVLVAPGAAVLLYFCLLPLFARMATTRSLTESGRQNLYVATDKGG